MTLIQLRYFCEACKWKSMNKAAEELYVSQPAISNAIKKLEEEFSTTLIVRQNDGWTLTNAGEYLLNSAKKILKEADMLKEKMEREYAQAQTIKIGLPPVYATWVLSRLEQPLKLLKKKYINLEIIMQENAFSRIEEAFRDDKIDLLFCTVMGRMPDYLTLIPLRSFELCVCVSKSNPLAQKKSLTIGDLVDQPFVVNYGMNSEYGKKIQRICKQNGIELQNRYFFRQMRTVKEIVRRDMAACFAHDEISDMNDEGIVRIPLKDAGGTEMMIAYDNRFPLRNEIADLISIFMKKNSVEFIVNK